jgi:hypothetical protein
MICQPDIQIHCTVHRHFTQKSTINVEYEGKPQFKLGKVYLAVYLNRLKSLIIVSHTTMSKYIDWGLRIISMIKRCPIKWGTWALYGPTMPFYGTFFAMEILNSSHV